jgi:hypothetical protein
MPLTYDQKSEIRLAFDEAFVPAERRRDFRVKHRVDAEICQWLRGSQGEPFHVRIEDFSPGGVGLIHNEPLPLDTDYLIKVPRPNTTDLVVLFTIRRCQPLEEGAYLVGAELSSVMDRTQMGKLVDSINKNQRLTSRRTRNLLVMLGVFGIGLAMLLS